MLHLYLSDILILRAMLRHLITVIFSARKGVGFDLFLKMLKIRKLFVYICILQPADTVVHKKCSPHMKLNKDGLNLITSFLLSFTCGNSQIFVFRIWKLVCSRICVWYIAYWMIWNSFSKWCECRTSKFSMSTSKHICYSHIFKSIFPLLSSPNAANLNFQLIKIGKYESTIIMWTITFWKQLIGYFNNYQLIRRIVLPSKMCSYNNDLQ